MGTHGACIHEIFNYTEGKTELNVAAVCSLFFVSVFFFFFSCFFVFFLSSAPNKMPKIAAMLRTVLQGALSRYFAPLHNTEICLHMRAYSKIGMKSTQQLQWDCLLISVVPDGKDGDRLHFKKFSLNFSKFSYPSLKQNQNCTMDYSSWNILTRVLVINYN